MAQTPEPVPLQSGDLISVAVAQDADAVVDIPDSFVGLGLFYSNLSTLVGRSVDRANPHFSLLLDRLARHQGPVPLRLGGGSVSETWYDPGGGSAPSGIDHEIDGELLAWVNLLLTNTGSKAIFGLNASVTEPTLFEDMANGILTHVDEGNIMSFELGNEPNRYEPNGRRPSGYDFDDFLEEADDFIGRFETAVNTTRPIVGPTMTLFRSTPEDDPDWTLRLPEFVDQFGSRVSTITQNRYPASDCASNPSSVRYASIENLLNDRSSIEQAAVFSDLIQATKSAGLPFAVHEHNTASCGGTDGVSNRFVSALWFLDSTFAWVEQGVERVFVPFVRSGFYAPFLPTENSPEGDWSTEVFPIFTGMELFAQTAGQGRQLVENRQITNKNARVWTTRDSNGSLYALIINKDLDASGRSRILVPGASEAATAIRLTAPSASSANDIRLGGLTWDGTSDAIPAGTPTSESISPNSDGVYDIDLPEASAALLVIPPLDGDNIVIARANAPSLAITSQTILLDATGSFGDIQDFQWEQISGPVVDITNANRQLAAVTFPIEGTYRFRLTVTNAEGTGNSEDITITVVDPPETTAFIESDRTFAFEAEAYTSISEGSGNFENHEWVVDWDSDASGGQFMRVTPSTGQRDRTGDEGPALEYSLAFETAGTWFVQVRMEGPDDNSDSLHIGLESPTTSPNGIRQEDGGWEWTGEIPGDGQAMITIPEPGSYTFRIWPREDGVWVDRIALALNENHNFSGTPDSQTTSGSAATDLCSTISTNPLSLHWQSTEDQLYLIETSTELLPGTWSIDSFVNANSQVTSQQITGANDDPRRFFRVREVSE